MASSRLHPPPFAGFTACCCLLVLLLACLSPARAADTLPVGGAPIPPEIAAFLSAPVGISYPEGIPDPAEFNHHGEDEEYTNISSATLLITFASYFGNGGSIASGHMINGELAIPPGGKFRLFSHAYDYWDGSGRATYQETRYIYRARRAPGGAVDLTVLAGPGGRANGSASGVEPGTLHPVSATKDTGYLFRSWVIESGAGQFQSTGGTTSTQPNDQFVLGGATTVIRALFDPEAPEAFQLVLFEAPIPATAELSSSESRVVLGEAVQLTLKQTLAGSGRLLRGPGLPGAGVSNPAASVIVTPPSSGTARYDYVVPGGHVQLRWRSNTPAGSFVITTPTGPVDVTGGFYYNVTTPGSYTITQTNSAGSATSAPLVVAMPAPALASVEVEVRPAPALGTLSLAMVENSVVVRAPGKAWDGKRYARCWREGQSWFAYLGREGVRFSCAGRLVGGQAGRVQLQGLSPAADAAWETLAETAATPGATGEYEATLSLLLGKVLEEAPLVPASWAAGAALTGEWRFRARLGTAAGTWSAWSAELPVRVVLPLVTREEAVSNLPPAGAEGAWFAASPEKTFRFSVWVP